MTRLTGAEPVAQGLDVGGQVGAAALLAGLDQDEARLWGPPAARTASRALSAAKAL